MSRRVQSEFTTGEKVVGGAFIAYFLISAALGVALTAVVIWAIIQAVNALT